MFGCLVVVRLRLFCQRHVRGNWVLFTLGIPWGHTLIRLLLLYNMQIR